MIGFLSYKVEIFAILNRLTIYCPSAHLWSHEALSVTPANDIDSILYQNDHARNFFNSILKSEQTMKKLDQIKLTKEYLAPDDWNLENGRNKNTQKQNFSQTHEMNFEIFCIERKCERIFELSCERNRNSFLHFGFFFLC